MKDFACGGAMCAENLMLERGVRLVADIMEIVMCNMQLIIIVSRECYCTTNEIHERVYREQV